MKTFRDSETFVALLVATALTLACSGNGESKKNASDDAGEDGGTDDDTSISEAVPVALRCSSSTATTYSNDPSAAESLTACIAVNADGAPVQSTNLKVRLEVDGQIIDAKIVPKSSEASPWLVGFELPPELQEKTVRVIVDIVTVDGKTLTGSTDDRSYDWTKDPLFTDFMNATLAILEFGHPPVKVDEGNGIYDAQVFAKPYHILFATDAVVDGSIGLRAADALCMSEGSKIDDMMGWRAVLGTLDLPATKRLTVTGTVFDMRGWIHAEAEKFWAGDWRYYAPYTSSGKHVLGVTVGTPPTFVTHALTGSLTEGDGRGDCDRLSSKAAKGSNTTLLDVLKLGASERSCARPARLLCLSQEHTPTRHSQVAYVAEPLGAYYRWLTQTECPPETPESCGLRFKIIHPHQTKERGTIEGYELGDLLCKGMRFKPEFDFRITVTDFAVGTTEGVFDVTDAATGAPWRITIKKPEPDRCEPRP